MSGYSRSGSDTPSTLRFRHDPTGSRSDTIARKYRLGADIRANELRVIGPENEQLGVMSHADAMAKAKEADLDLVEMAPNAKPPVARIMDFGKYQYEQDKQQQKQKKSKAGMVKEVRLTMKISPHDLGYRMERAKTFLDENQKVKLNLMMKGRENANPKAAIARVKELADSLEGAKREGEPTRQGRSISVLVTPDKSAKPKAEKSADKESKSEDDSAEK